MAIYKSKNEFFSCFREINKNNITHTILNEAIINGKYLNEDLKNLNFKLSLSDEEFTFEEIGTDTLSEEDLKKYITYISKGFTIFYKNEITVLSEFIFQGEAKGEIKNFYLQIIFKRPFDLLKQFLFDDN